jgi:hypothetical protein
MFKTLGLAGLLLFTGQDSPPPALQPLIIKDSLYFSPVRVIVEESRSIIALFDEYIDQDGDDSVDIVRHYCWDTREMELIMAASDYNEKIKALIPLIQDLMPDDISTWTEYITSKIDSTTLGSFDKAYLRYSNKGIELQEEYKKAMMLRDFDNVYRMLYPNGMHMKIRQTQDIQAR